MRNGFSCGRAGETMPEAAEFGAVRHRAEVSHMRRFTFPRFVTRPRVGLVLGGVAALGLVGVQVLGVAGAQANTGSKRTDIRIAAASVTGGNLTVKVSATCPAGDVDYLYVEADQDLPTNDTAGHVLLSSFTCKGFAQTLVVTVPSGTGTSHFEFDNDGEGDDTAAFTTGDVGVSATFGGISNFTMIEEELSV
jgi:hypothetical protein